MSRSSQNSSRTTLLRGASFIDFLLQFVLVLVLSQHDQREHPQGSVQAFSSIVADHKTAVVVADHPNRNRVLLDPAVSRDRASLGNLQVPHVGIGTIAWSSSHDIKSWQHQELQSLVDTACDNDIGFFDTAERYGSSLKAAVGLGWGETEQLTTRLLRTIRQESIISSSHAPVLVATKFTPSPWRTTVQSVIDACEDSRKRLGVNQIDLYQLHMPDIVQPFQRFSGGKSKPKDVVYWQGLAECYHRGLVKNIGVSNYGPTLLAQCQSVLSDAGVPLASNQIAYSLLGRHNGSKETLEYCNDNNIRVLAFFPLAMGLLTGKYQDDDDDGAPFRVSASKHGRDSLKVTQKSVIETRDLLGYSKRISPLLRVMRQMATAHDKTVAQVALNYIVGKGAIPIPGARTQQQLIDNAGAMGWRLSAVEMEQLEMESDRLGFGFDGAGFKRANEKFVGYGMETWTLD